ncbi:MAG: hypothetical protein P1T08_17125 [Acidimicrobiia bacterium]|nr:hypothetical protein [Acidimicrobiia bacterium]
MFCIEPSAPLTETLRLLAEGPKPVEQLPVAGLDQLRLLQWVMGDTVVELTGIGWYHAGHVKGGLLG